MQSTDNVTKKTEIDSQRGEPLEHWGLQLLRMLAVIDQLNACAHKETEGNVNKCRSCSLRLQQLVTECSLTRTYLLGENYFTPAQIQRHIGLPRRRGA